MKFRPEIEYQPQGPGKRYCCWGRGEGLNAKGERLNAKYAQCKWLSTYYWASSCILFEETACFRDDRNRVLRCPQCVQAQKEMDP